MPLPNSLFIPVPGEPWNPCIKLGDACRVNDARIGHDARVKTLTLILGGARSGKSRRAEALVTALPPPWTYIATAEAFDTEMAARIEAHRARREAGWRTLDAPRDLPARLREGRPPLLVDCLTLWLSNLMLAERDVAAETSALEAALAAREGPVVLVSNEVGSGIVPATPLGRRFRDAQGLLNQRMAAIADRVELVVAGLPLRLK
jgi:adenosylcobinamide kinase/adenosylcobinamide-phosphate guanylyltransferase